MSVEPLRAPFPWFGGKSRAAHLIWPRLGNVPNYVEPFAGSLAVLLRRPHAPGNEIINDLDCYVANAWRAVRFAPEEVASHCDWPVNEADLHARHRHLHLQGGFRQRMEEDPDYYDARLAAWWIWGLSCWIGDNFCRPSRQSSSPRLTTGARGVARQVPHLTGGQGVARKVPASTAGEAPAARSGTHQGASLGDGPSGPASAGTLEDAARAGRGPLDVEALDRRHEWGRGTLILFDIMGTASDYRERRAAMLASDIPTFSPYAPPTEQSEVWIVPSMDRVDATRLWHDAPKINEALGCIYYEGIVAKFNTQYAVGETVTWVKHRFTTE